MTLSDHELRVIRSTWARVVPVSGMASELFYGRLFKVAPETRLLFKDDLAEQGRKLIATLAFVVDHLERSDELTKAATELAIRHVDYGVTPDQYAPVGAALIWTFERLLGPAFGADERAAWLAAYSALSEKMIAAAYGDTHA